MRVIWKGSISFGLVNIPVKMYHASRDHELKFVLLHKKDLSEIRYARICKSEDKEVPWEELVKGFEFQKGEYVVMNQEDFEKANVKKTRTIEIVSFANEDEIDPIFYEKPYYLEPDKNAESTYALLCEALRKSKKVGIAKYVIHNREHIAVLKPYHNAILLNQMRYDDEMVKLKELEIPDIGKIPAKEVDIAIKLIDHLTKPFTAKEYKDTYTEEIKEIIAQKAKGKKIVAKGKEPKPTKVTDIMSLLKASLQAPKKTPKRRSA
jgi:DNA end-binding protein Ku